MSVTIDDGIDDGFFDANYEDIYEQSSSERPRTKADLQLHVEMCYGYTFPDTPVCEGHCSPMEVLWELFKSTIGHMLIIGSRESGKTLIFAFAEHLLMRWNGDEIFHGAGIYPQAKRCFTYVEKAATDKAKPYFAREVTKCIEDEVRLIGPSGREAKLEIKSATLEQLNGPHPRVVMLDEVELIGDKELNEAASMPHRDAKLPHLPPVLHYTSSLKKAYGPMVKFLEEKEKRGLQEFRFCVFEVIERCPEERHQDGVGCNTCPLATYCRETVRDNETGEVRLKEGPGRAARAGGWMLIDDVIAKMRLMDVGVFRSQWLSLEPQIEGLIYPTFQSNVHVLNYKFNPNLPVVAGMDWGYTNPHCILYAQQQYDDAVVVFAEDYRNMEIESKMAANCNATPWRQNIDWIMSDPSAPALIANFSEAGIRNVLPADNDVSAGIDDVRWALQSADLMMPPMLYFDASCVNLIREIKAYHRADPGRDLDPTEKPRKIDDHAMDALRYLIRRLFRARARILQ
jgi:hypothetical protein